MNVLFISYWGIEDGLTRSTVLPNIKLLSELKHIDIIYLVTIERNSRNLSESIDNKIIHIPQYSGIFPVTFLNKFMDFLRIPANLARLIKSREIHKIIARGAMAGALAYLIWKKTKIPFYVESFEPHALYMNKSKLWSKWDLRYLFQTRWESGIKKFASGLITVSLNYKNKLLEEGINQIPIEVAPCAVNLKDFAFDPQKRARIRDKFKIPDQMITGIYLGKFGGIYYDYKSFDLFKTVYDYFDHKFFLILISPENQKGILRKVQLSGFPFSHIKHMAVDHRNVPDYLSASDFGFAPIRSDSSRLYCSPVKIGEYWANGLPVLLTRGVGDENNFLEKESGGALFDIENPIPALQKIEQILRSPDHRAKIPVLAGKYRSFTYVKEAYQKLICC